MIIRRHLRLRAAAALRRRAQRGFTLVELAIVLTISLMMMSWLAVSYYESKQDERTAETRATMEIIKSAIMAYATAHSAPGYVYYNGDATNAIYRRMPGNRPYLPCPDITGDGVEDRRSLANLAITLTVSGSSGEYPLEDYGSCYASKGLLPWRTLEVPNTDPWGNFYTYRVDKNFSDAMVGFDQQTRADQSYYARPLTAAVVSTRTLAFRQADSGALHTLVATVDISEAVGDIYGLPTSVSAAVVTVSLVSDRRPSIICRQAPCSAEAVTVSASTLRLLAGEVAVTAMTLRTDGFGIPNGTYVSVAAGEVVGGVPFVVVSHGRNGYGAAKHHHGNTMVCNIFPAGSGATYDHERQNAYRGTALSGRRGVCPRVDSVGEEYGFVSAPISRSDGTSGGSIQNFDDIVGWMSVEEVVSALAQRGKLPADTLPPLGLEDD